MRNRMAAAVLAEVGETVERTTYVIRASLIQPRRRSMTSPPVMEPDMVSVAQPSFDDGGRDSVPTSDTYAKSPFRVSESSLNVAWSLPPSFAAVVPMGASITRDQLWPTDTGVFGSVAGI